MKMRMKAMLSVGGKWLLLLFMVAFVSACEDTDCIKGEGAIETQTLELAAFNRIEVNGDFKVYLQQGETQKVEVKGEPNILSQLRTTISNDTWKIEHQECVRRSEDVEVFITVPELQSVYLNGSGNIESRQLFTVTDLEVSVNGSGKIMLNTNADRVVSRVTGSGKIILQGIAPNHQVNISGSGRAEAFELNSENVSVNLSGSGAAEVTAETSLDVTISGSGNVYYQGEPSITQNISGSGKLIKR